jgi:lipopolysaccharide export LptBFGC system permease protein LptF
MTTYTKRDIRAADILAMILFGFGVVLVCFAVFKTTGTLGKEGGSVVGTWIIAGVFLALGTALNLKVRQLVRTKGAEPVDCDGVSD